MGRLRSEDGIAVPLTVSALLLTLVLAAAVGDVSVRGSAAATDDSSSKRALAAAEAGLQHAQSLLADKGDAAHLAECINRDGSAAVTTAGNCPWGTGWEEMGNGAQYRFVVGATTVGPCAVLPGQTVQSHDRCITAQGRVGAVLRRLQRRVNAPPPKTPFKDVALFGDKRLIANNLAELHVNLGTNRDLQAATRFDLDADKLLRLGGPTATAVFGQPGQRPPETSIVRGQTMAFQQADYESPELRNDNARLKAAVDAQLPGRATYSPGTTNVLEMTQGLLVLETGTYYLCGLRTTNSFEIRVKPGHRVNLFVDSYTRRDAAGNKANNCPEPSQVAWSGKVLFGAQADVNFRNADATLTNDPDRLSLFVHGRGGTLYPGTDEGTYVAGRNLCDGVDDPDADLDFLNQVNFTGRIYAPTATARFCNHVKMTGGLLTREAAFMNSVRFWATGSNAGWELPGSGQILRRGWFECPPGSAATADPDPEAGCVT